MTEKLSSIEPKAKASKNAELEARVELLETLVIKLASLSGNGNMLREFGFKMWTPGQADMRKYTG